MSHEPRETGMTLNIAVHKAITRLQGEAVDFDAYRDQAYLVQETAEEILRELVLSQAAPLSPPEGVPQETTTPDWRQMLLNVVSAWDADDDLAFLAATFKARRALGLKLADGNEEREDEEALRANGMLEDTDV